MVSRKWKNGDYGLAKAWSRIRGHEGDGITRQSRVGWMLLGKSLALGLRSERNNHVSVVLVGGRGSRGGKFGESH